MRYLVALAACAAILALPATAGAVNLPPDVWAALGGDGFNTPEADLWGLMGRVTPDGNVTIEKGLLGCGHDCEVGGDDEEGGTTVCANDNHIVVCPKENGEVEWNQPTPADDYWYAPAEPIYEYSPQTWDDGSYGLYPSAEEECWC